MKIFRDDLDKKFFLKILYSLLEEYEYLTKIPNFAGESGVANYKAVS